LAVPLATKPLVDALAGQELPLSWRKRLASFSAPNTPQLHLAVMNEPFLSLVLEGRKTIESRFSVNRAAPYGSVEAGDVLALKAQSGPVVGLAFIEHVGLYELDARSWRELKQRFAGPLCATDRSFWDERRHARYATLMRVSDPLAIAPIVVAKRDRRGWVVLPSAPAEIAA
jgi:hypothetical protein